jgi:cytochrome P450
VRRRAGRPADIGDALGEAAATIVSPEGHADDARVHAAFDLLRREAPLHRVELPGIAPFRAVTRYRDLVEVERRNAAFAAGPRTILSSELVEAGLRQATGRAQIIRPLTHMDEPDHSRYRAAVQARFAPAALAALEAELAEAAGRALDAAAGARCDFAADVAVPYSLGVILRLLGVPESDHPHLLALTRGFLGAEDPARRLAELPTEGVRIALQGFRDYFDALAAARRAQPRDDIATAIATARIEGAPMPHFERVSYYVLMVTAGHDTAAFAIAGGLQALLAHPEQRALLARDPGLLDGAIEEMLRWTSPVRHFMRTATAETELGGTPIAAGEALALFFPSANRDEAVFAEPGRFRIDRAPNPHVAFGRGPHFCLGHQLARLEMRALFRALLPRLERIEPAGPPRRARSAFMSGIAALPIRWG